MLKPSFSRIADTCLKSIVLFFLSSSLQAEIVYENVDNYLSRFANEKREYGDEIELSGSARTVTEFAFEYYGNFVSNADESAKIRFYRNDVVLNQFQVAPGTLLYESGWFFITPGFNSRRITGLNVEVPDAFTFTIEFRGLSMKAGDEAGLLFYHPITIGKSYDDFWIKEPNGEFRLYGYEGVKNNFGVQVIAVDSVPSVSIETIRKEGTNIVISAHTRIGYNYRLQRRSSVNSGDWTTLETIPGTGILASFSPLPASESSAYFRIVLVPIGTDIQVENIRKEGSDILISLQTEAGIIYKIEQANSITSTEWNMVGAVVGTGQLATFPPIAAENAAGFFRVALQ